MVENKLPPAMWCKLAVTVIYLKDFIPTACCPDTMPYETWYQMKLDVSHLHPIGCNAYVKIPVKRGESKLESCLIKGTLIGYFGCDAYRVFDPVCQKIFCSHDVVFEEGIGHKTLPLMLDHWVEGHQ